MKMSEISWLCIFWYIDVFKKVLLRKDKGYHFNSSQFLSLL